MFVPFNFCVASESKTSLILPLICQPPWNYIPLHDYNLNFISFLVGLASQIPIELLSHASVYLLTKNFPRVMIYLNIISSCPLPHKSIQLSCFPCMTGIRCYLRVLTSHSKIEPKFFIFKVTSLHLVMYYYLLSFLWPTLLLYIYQFVPLNAFTYT